MNKNDVVSLLAMLVFANGLVLMTESTEDLRMMSKCFYRVCLKRVNVAKSEFMMFGDEDERSNV